MEEKKSRFCNLKRFLQLLSESLWSLVKLNLIFLVSCLPLLTIGPALTALSCCIQELIQGDIPEETPVYSYWKAFRHCFKKSIGWGLLALFGTLILGNALLYYLGHISANILYIPLASLTLLGLLFLWGILLHLFPLLGSGETDGLFKKAAYRLMVRLPQTFLLFLLAAALLALEVVFFPADFPIILFIGIAIPAVICGFAYQDAPDDM